MWSTNRAPPIDDVELHEGMDTEFRRSTPSWRRGVAILLEVDQHQVHIALSGGKLANRSMFSAFARTAALNVFVAVVAVPALMERFRPASSRSRLCCSSTVARWSRSAPVRRHAVCRTNVGV
jgi:hypothetical protein